MQRRRPALVRPARHHVAEVDGELSCARLHSRPAAVGQAHLQPALGVGRGEDRHRAVIGVRTGAELTRQRRLGEYRVMVAGHDAEVPRQDAVEERFR